MWGLKTNFCEDVLMTSVTLCWESFPDKKYDQNSTSACCTLYHSIKYCGSASGLVNYSATGYWVKKRCVYHNSSDATRYCCVEFVFLESGFSSWLDGRRRKRGFVQHSGGNIVLYNNTHTCVLACTYTHTRTHTHTHACTHAGRHISSINQSNNLLIMVLFVCRYWKPLHTCIHSSVLMEWVDGVEQVIAMYCHLLSV